MKLRTLALLSVLACASPNENATTTVTSPDRASFPAVSGLLEKRCGTLDCHGSAYRNLRIYGAQGMRLDPNDRPLSKGMTTDAEYDHTFRSIVGLEPELTSTVVIEHGAKPDRLTFVRKARGSEHHKGNSLMQEGDAADRCIVSWLAGMTDVAGCTAATNAAF